SQCIFNDNFQGSSQHTAGGIDFFLNNSGCIGGILAFQRTVTCQDCGQTDFDGFIRRSCLLIISRGIVCCSCGFVRCCTAGQQSNNHQGCQQKSEQFFHGSFLLKNCRSDLCN